MVFQHSQWNRYKRLWRGVEQLHRTRHGCRPSNIQNRLHKLKSSFSFSDFTSVHAFIFSVAKNRRVLLEHSNINCVQTSKCQKSMANGRPGHTKHEYWLIGNVRRLGHAQKHSTGEFSKFFLLIHCKLIFNFQPIDFPFHEQRFAIEKLIEWRVSRYRA